MELSDAREVLRLNPLFSSLTDAEIDSIGAKFSPKIYQRGDLITQIGASSNTFYVIHSGLARVVDQQSEEGLADSMILRRGGSFGEESLISDGPSHQTVEAEATLILMRLSTTEFQSFLGEFPRLSKPLESRIRHSAEFRFLMRLKLLPHLTLSQAEKLITQIESLLLIPGEPLFLEGQSGDSCFLLRSGRVHLFSEDTSRWKTAVIGRGRLIGEMSMLQGTPHTSRAVAATDAALLRLRADTFHRLFPASKVPRLVVELAAQRLSKNSETPATLRDGAHTAEPRRAHPPLCVRRLKAGTGLFARSYPFVSVETPILGGLGCLAMIDAFYKKDNIRADDLTEQLLQGQPDSLITLSSKAEERGYLTRMLELEGNKLQQAPLPAIVEDQHGSSAVVFEISSHEATLGSPLYGLRQVPRHLFEEGWNGLLLALTCPTESLSADSNKSPFLKRLISLAAPYTRRLVEIAMISLLIQLFGLAVPLCSQVIIDRVLVSADISLLKLLLLGVVFVSAFQMIAICLREYLTAHSLQRIDVSLRLQLLNHILRLPQKILSTWQVSDFALRFSESEKLMQLISKSATQMFIDSLSIFIFLIALLLMNLRLTTVVLVYVVSYGLLMVFYSSFLRAHNRHVFRSRQETESSLIESLTSIQTIKSMATEMWAFRRGQTRILNLKAQEFKVGIHAANVVTIGTLLSQAATLTILAYGALLALEGSLSAGALVAFLGIFTAILTPLNGLISVWDEFHEIRTSLDRTNEVLILEKESNPRSAVAPAIEGHVLFRNVTFRYPGSQTDAVKDVNLSVLPGQKIAFVGRTGSGKTTLANLMVNFYQPNTGTIFIDQMDISNIQRTVLRQQIGFVEQHPFIFNGSVHENIAKADPSADPERIVAAATLAGAHEFIESLPQGYDTLIGERGMMLSGGERQRLVIARTILNDPRILILDEATSSLDTESEGTIHDNLETIMSKRTVFLISHRLSAVRTADLIAMLDGGRIVELGSHAELLEKRGLYYYMNTKST